jgi:two-component system response regulator HydG
MRVLVVDDEVDLAHALADNLYGDGCQCDVASDGNAALAALAKDRFDVVISDVRMRGMGGMELLDRIRQTPDPVPVILVSGFGGATTAATALEHGAARFLAKPYDLEDLRLVLRNEIAGNVRARMFGERRSSRASEHEVVGPVMRRLVLSLGRAARAGSPLLIRGESGAGKEVVARALHAMGPRRDEAFVAMNVSAVPSQLLESELFGHARGAFTGATASRRGLLAEANGGTLLLDEIGDMPLELQSKLLRVLQDGEVRAVGADKPRHVDVRFIAATHRDLPSLVRQGKFRHDLFFRLNVVPISIPPLRERKADIVPLAMHFLTAARHRMPDSPVRAIAPDAWALLRHAEWPGNVRELASTMERVVVASQSEIATRDEVRAALDLADVGTDQDPKGAKDPTREPKGPIALADELRSLDGVIRDHVAAVLRRTDGNKTRAAKILGVNLSTLYRWQRNVAKA